MVSVQFTPDQVAKAVEATERTLGLMKALANLTPNRYDDEAVKAVEAFVNAVKPYVREEWFVSLLALLTSLFEKKDAAVVKAALSHIQSL